MSAPLVPLVQDALIEKILSGDRRSLARLISRVENARVESGDSSLVSILSALHTHTGKAYRVGITGPPGAGKSTLTNKLAQVFRKESMKVGIIAVDPTSPFTGGALLGDRVRMTDIMLDEGIFIRSMATRGSLGGLAEKAGEVADVLDAAGFDLIIYETVGVGQSELDIVSTADTTLVVLVPESGDSIQAMKAGLMEIADVFVMNKADHADADKAVLALQTSLGFRDHDEHSWMPAVVKAISVSGAGVLEIRSEILRHKTYLEQRHLLGEKRLKREKELIKKIVEQHWRNRFWTAARESELASLLSAKRSPYDIADTLFSQ